MATERRIARSVGGMLAGTTLLVGCATDTGDGDSVRSDVDHEPVAVSESAAAHDAAAATTVLGTGLLAEAASESGSSGNAVVSPASLAVVLAMLAEGAGGPAADALDEALGASGDERGEAYGALQAAVGEFDGDPAVVQDEELPERPLLHLANHLAVDESIEVGDGFLDGLARNFDSGVTQADLASDGQRILDEWVAENTGGLIEESAIDVAQGPPEFVLQNAVVLAARWANQFDPNTTRSAEFRTGDGDVTEVETMHQDLSAAYTESDGAQAVRLPYTEAFAMDVVLPPEGTDPAELDPAFWSGLDEELGGEEAGSPRVGLALPTLDVTADVSLMAALESLGLGPVAAGDSLDGIAPGAQLTQLEQQAVLQVDEEGTVAAAVTEGAGVVSAPAPPEVQMHVDRPYALRIVHAETGWPLFMAAINDPGV